MGPFEFGTVFSSLKSAGELAKAMMDVKDATTFQTKAFELTREIIAAQQGALSAQAAQQSLLQEVRHLKEQLVKLEAWATEKQRYELTDHGGGTFTRTLKPSMAEGEPSHRLCAQCYEQGKKGLLQSQGHFHGREKVQCMSCTQSLMLGVQGRLPTSYLR
jgi:hypothetical protein